MKGIPNLFCKTRRLGISLLLIQLSVVQHVSVGQNVPAGQNSSVAQKLNVKLRHITSEQGLSQSMVNCILQDHRGFMWFGTQDGLNRYDGNKIKVYSADPDNPQSIAGNFVSCLLEDNQGRIWIGSENNGISIYDPRTDNFIRLLSEEANKSSLSDNSIKNLCLGRDTKIWVATAKGLNAIDLNTLDVQRYFIGSSEKPEIITNEIYLIVEHPAEQKLWVITPLGIYSFDKQTARFTRLSLSDRELGKINSATVDNAGHIYINTNLKGIKMLDVQNGLIKEDQFAQLRYKKGDVFQITSASRNNEGVYYYGTDKKGILLLDSKGNYREISSGDQPGNLLSDKIHCIYFDPSGYMWVGTDLGVDFLQAGKLKFKTITTQDFETGALGSNDIMSVLKDGNRLLLGTSSKGLSVIDLVSGKALELPKGIPYGSENGVLSILKNAEDSYWLGTWGGGLVKVDLKNKTFRNFKASNSILSGQNITCMTKEGGKLWIGTLEEGLFLLDERSETFSKYTVNNGLSSNSIYFLGLDKNGELWIGTVAGGFDVLNTRTKKIRVYKHENSSKHSLSSNTVNYVYHDDNGIAWIATDNGLNRFDPGSGSFLSYYKKDGLPNNYIYSILPDERGNLWMSTNKGLSKFNPFVENTDGSAFTNYGPDDGLQGEEFNQGAYYTASDGQLYFGGLNGISVFYPERLTSSSHIPPVYITSYKRFNKEVKLDSSVLVKRHIGVSYKDNSFSFEFTALDFDDPGRNKYSWKMEGLQRDWSPPGIRNIAEYPELSPGEYTFRVRASNSDGEWNTTGTSIRISVYPPWYKTKLAYFFFVLAMLVSTWGFSQYRTLRVALQKKALERMVLDRTIQLADKNRDITSSIEYARKIQDAILPPLSDIHKAFSDSFIFYKPRDIVSGDFYWFYEKGDKKIIAIVDCTGHGVPGAFMSMIGHNLLNQVVIEKGIFSAAEILNQLRKGIQAALKQGNSGIGSKDGMDIALCVFDAGKNQIRYAGAYRPLYLFSDAYPEKLKKINGDKFPVGGAQFGEEQSFTEHILQLNKGDMIYLFTDGYSDQFGGEKGRKFMLKQLTDLLGTCWHHPAKEQQRILEESFADWKKSNDQVDDVLIAGIRV